MDDMPRPRPPHLHRQVTPHGKTVWYVRVIKDRASVSGPRSARRSSTQSIRRHTDLPAQSEGQEECASAGTLVWLIERYRETGAWTNLSLATRRQRENIFRPVRKLVGHSIRQEHDDQVASKAWLVISCPRRTGERFPRRHAGSVPLGGLGGMEG